MRVSLELASTEDIKVGGMPSHFLRQGNASIKWAANMLYLIIPSRSLGFDVVRHSPLPGLRTEGAKPCDSLLGSRRKETT